MEKREPSYTIGENVNWYSQYEEHYRRSLKTENKANIRPINHTPGHISRENHNSKRYMHPSVYSNATYNSQDMDAT